MPRLTLLLPPSRVAHLRARARAQGRTRQEYLRDRFFALLTTHNLMLRQGIPPAAEPPSVPCYVTLAPKVHWLMRNTAVRLGYASLSDLARAMLALEDDPFEQVAAALGWRGGGELQEAVAAGEVLVVNGVGAGQQDLAPLLATLGQDHSWPAAAADPDTGVRLTYVLNAVSRALGRIREWLAARVPAPEARPAELPPGLGLDPGPSALADPAANPPLLLDMPWNPPDYRQKFAGLVAGLTARRCQCDRPDLVVPSPATLGDNYAEVVQLLSLVAEAGCALYVTTPLTAPEWAWCGQQQEGVAPATEVVRVLAGDPSSVLFAYPADLGANYAEMLASLSACAERQVRISVRTPQPGSYSLAQLQPLAGRAMALSSGLPSWLLPGGSAAPPCQ